MFGLLRLLSALRAFLRLAQFFHGVSKKRIELLQKLFIPLLHRARDRALCEIAEDVILALEDAEQLFPLCLHEGGEHREEFGFSLGR